MELLNMGSTCRAQGPARVCPCEREILPSPLEPSFLIMPARWLKFWEHLAQEELLS